MILSSQVLTTLNFVLAKGSCKSRRHGSAAYFLEDHRQCFVDYQMDPRYRNLYDLADFDATRANQLFDPPS